MPTPTALPVSEAGQHLVQADLVAVLVAVTAGQPRILTTEGGRALPAGPLSLEHRSLQTSLRSWVETQTRHPLGYVEQLYTFPDRERTQTLGMRAISISYLGLTCEPEIAAGGWRDWYAYFPWEDWRDGEPAVVQGIVKRLQAWCRLGEDRAERSARLQRVSLMFGLDEQPWNEEWVLQRYELMFEAGLVAEAGSEPPGARADALTGHAMARDHRRVLATGIARLRAKIKYRPVVFELLAPEFSLLQLQQTMEALAGRGLHKQNFRRQIEQQALVEPTGQQVSGAAGRPAQLFRFRSKVMLERAMTGNKLPLIRNP